MFRDFGHLLDHSWYHFPDMPISSIANSLRAPIIQPQVRSLTRTLASREIKSYLPLNRGGTRKDLDSRGALRETFHLASPPVTLKKWPHHPPGALSIYKEGR
jgi:hypothetical protein